MYRKYNRNASIVSIPPHQIFYKLEQRIVILKGTVFLDLEADNLEHILDVLLGRTWFTMAADS